MVDALSGSSASNQIRLQQAQQAMFKKMDVNGDSKVDRSEFVSAKPKDVTEQQAGALFDALDSGKSGSLSADDIKSGFARLSSSVKSTLINAQAGAQAAEGGRGGPPSAADMFKKSDTDGDGKVTKQEFVNSRPDNVSEDQAGAFFDRLDTQKSGSLTEDQMTTALQSEGPGGPPPGGGGPGGPGGGPGGPPPGGGRGGPGGAVGGGGQNSQSSQLASLLGDSLSSSSGSSSDSSDASDSSKSSKSSNDSSTAALLETLKRASQSYGSSNYSMQASITRSFSVSF
ncbi:putative EF-hand domain-containing protein [Azospirillaceae bacterium]